MAAGRPEGGSGPVDLRALLAQGREASSRLAPGIASIVLEQSVRLATEVTGFVEPRILPTQPKTDFLPQSPSLHSAWRDRLTPIVDAHLPEATTPETVDQARTATVRELRRDLVVSQATLATVAAIGDIFYHEGHIVLPPDQVEATRSSSFPTGSPAGEYQRGSQIGTLLMQATQGILAGDQTTLGGLKRMEDTLDDPATPLTENQQAQLRQALIERLSGIARQFRFKSVEALLAQSLTDIAVEDTNLTLYNELAPVQAQAAAIDEALFGDNAQAFQEQTLFTISDTLTAINGAITTDHSRQTHIAHALGIGKLRKLDSGLTPARQDVQLKPTTIQVAAMIHGLLEAFKPTTYYSEQEEATQPATSLGRYQALMRQIDDDLQQFPLAIESYFGLYDRYERPFMSERAERFGIATETGRTHSRSSTDIERELRQTGDMIWLTVAAVLGVEASGDMADTKKNVYARLLELRQEDVALAPETTSTIALIEDTTLRPNVSVSFRRRGPLPDGSITISPFRGDGSEITEEQARAVVEYHPLRQIGASRRGFLN